MSFLPWEANVFFLGEANVREANVGEVNVIAPFEEHKIKQLYMSETNMLTLESRCKSIGSVGSCSYLKNFA